MYALEPELVATWGRQSEYRFIQDKFGLGTPRTMLELPKFSAWKRAVYQAATKLGLNQIEMKRLEEVFQLFSGHKCKRPATVCDGLRDWLHNAEVEHDRQPFGAILATASPRSHPAVITAEKVGDPDPRWHRPTGATPRRTPRELAAVLTGMLVNCRELHLVDPYFSPRSGRHRDVLLAFLEVIAGTGGCPKIHIHCSGGREKDCKLDFFNDEAKKLTNCVPQGLELGFVRLRSQREGLHNRYVLTDLGGVTLGVGLDRATGPASDHTDDISLMSREQYSMRWRQYVTDDGSFLVHDRPQSVVGRAGVRRDRRGRR